VTSEKEVLMARQVLDIGSAPPMEECAMLGDDNYVERATAEMRRFIALIRKRCGVEPEGAILRVIFHRYDVMDYGSVECVYDDEDRAAVEYCYAVEANTPERWEEG
jgi:hypothetical protein